MIDYYTQLLADEERIKAFQKAITTAVRPDDVVVEIGAGVGTFSIFAARAGARRVFSIESSSVIEFARQIASKNEVKIDFVAGDALEVDLPEPASLLIFEDFATGLLDGATRSLLNHALSRWMGEGFRVLPESASLHIAPMSSALSRSEAFPLAKMTECPYGLNLQPIQQAIENTVRYLRSPTDIKLLADPQELLALQLGEPLPTSWATDGVIEIAEDGEFDGLCMWHDFHLDQATTYSNRPTGEGVYGQVYFPVPRRWTLTKGSRLTYQLRFETVASDGMWAWSIEARSTDGTIEQHFSGNSFAATFLTPKNIQRYDANQIVQLTDQVKSQALVLSLVDGQRTLLEVTKEVQKQLGIDDISEAMELVLRFVDKPSQL